MMISGLTIEKYAIPAQMGELVTNIPVQAGTFLNAQFDGITEQVSRLRTTL